VLLFYGMAWCKAFRKRRGQGARSRQRQVGLRSGRGRVV